MLAVGESSKTKTKIKWQQNQLNDVGVGFLSGYRCGCNPNPHKHTPHERGPVRAQKGLQTDLQGEVSTASEDRDTARERAGAVGRRRGTRSLHTQSLRGLMQERKERAREGRYLLDFMLVTDDTSQLPMSWSNACASLNTAQVPHAPQATPNPPHQQKNEARSEFKKVFQRIRKVK
jgi:hypothetical protein